MLYMKIIIFTCLFFSLISVRLTAQKLSRTEFDSLLKGAPLLLPDKNFSTLKEYRYVKYAIYKKIVQGYSTFDSVYTYGQNFKKSPGGSWLDVKSDSELVNVDNTDRSGKIIPG